MLPLRVSVLVGFVCCVRVQSSAYHEGLCKRLHAAIIDAKPSVVLDFLKSTTVDPMCENETSESTWKVIGDIVNTRASTPADVSLVSWVFSSIFCIGKPVAEPTAAEHSIYNFLWVASTTDSMTCDCIVPIGIKTPLKLTRNPPLARAVLNRNPDWLGRLLLSLTENPVRELNAQNMTATAIANRLIVDGNLNDTETKVLKQMIGTLKDVTEGAECNSATPPKRGHWAILPCSVLNEYCL
eukprot:GEMP01063531.1.p1 GENE.GEMP01063531.1~~GEMP01063531.1.p1  ORF type:complete len:240 (-),score=24.41 GEMP01063531.1:544-1263(-)